MSLISWLEENMLACPYKKYWGIDCLGCGIQRSFVALLKGDLASSFYYYPALIPMMLMFLFLIAHISFKIKNGAIWLKYLFIFNISIVVIHFVLKQIQ